MQWIIQHEWKLSLLTIRIRKKNFKLVDVRKRNFFPFEKFKFFASIHVFDVQHVTKTKSILCMSSNYACEKLFERVLLLMKKIPISWSFRSAATELPESKTFRNHFKFGAEIFGIIHKLLNSYQLRHHEFKSHEWGSECRSQRGNIIRRNYLSYAARSLRFFTIL